ncbi:DNA repair protein [Rhizophagus irregularis DAOM 181602=DAOM 197198]|uniref:DNA repair protein RAD14 n=2 Tax=Rhizophagus irregularis TaxID=588596 RepID=A0A015I8E4_RHIIW|nr:DNA repair protein Rad14, putative [Rhizophagus irregularis DAOM 181602=DAOM 197198]EXX53442.1 Rad14p [Rhizophagus irregularis DAOM 197198w]POG82322.1 DNA repair protein Rad14, putative [Rhizophagus irregularis DAOM 181602=DAOM 197198]GBC33742.2 DNA repair protein [Rhizophagus irregularis DAOM 181602=DAOM 197198]|eukprot:XP_025189188.1 DNA repair protein Rad14, putative [Rhizophagus irregularis DAOM 181602=DAOM 197198]
MSAQDQISTNTKPEKQTGAIYTISLTPEQVKRIEENRLKAQAKLREKQKRDQQNNLTSTEQKGIISNNGNINETKGLRPMKKFQNYVEYDFSKMKDTRGGFLSEQQDETPKKRKWEPPEPEFEALEPSMSIDPAENQKCKECNSVELDNLFRKTFKVNVCKNCKEKYPEKYSLITKSEAKEDYLLTDPELRDVEILPHLSKPNPHKATWNNMMLYLREQVEEFAFKKWGGEEGLDEEYERRVSLKKKKKDKKFKSKLADLRKRTRTDVLTVQKNHKHEFGETEEDPETGVTTQSCEICGMQIEVDIL